MLEIHHNAPSFSLPDQNGTIHSLAQYVGQWIVIYFYPKDMTPGCTTQACNFRDNYPLLTQKAVVLGVSADSQASHAQFAAKHQLPFPLLADESKAMIKAYGAWGPFTKRISYLINPSGKIAKIYTKVDPKTHVQQVIQHLNALQ